MRSDFVPLAMSASEQQDVEQVSSRDVFFKECLDPPFAGGYRDAHDWAFDKFTAHNLSITLDRFNAHDFTFTFDEALENMLLARLAYVDEPSLGEFVVPRDYFWKSVFQRCLAYMAPSVSLEEGLKDIEVEGNQEPVLDPAPANNDAVAPTPSPVKGSNIS